MMSAKLVALSLLSVAAVACSTMTPEERAQREFHKEMLERDAASVRITRNIEAVRGCESLGIVSDDSFKDMQKKVARRGGNVALLTSQELVSHAWMPRTLVYSYVAEVYRCERPEADPGVCPPGTRWMGKGCVSTGGGSQ